MADIPDSPDVSQLPAFSQNPLQQMAAQQLTPAPLPPPQQSGKLKQLMQAFFYGGGEAAMKHVGLETPDEKAQREVENQFKQQQLEQAKQLTMQKLNDAQTLQQLKNYLGLEQIKGRQQVAETAAGAGITKAQIMANATRAKMLETGAEITPELAEKYGLPEDFVGKIMKVSDVKGRESVPIMKARLGIAAGNLSLRQKIFERDTFGTLFGEDIPSSLIDEKGNTIGWKSPSSPTGSIKTQAQQSQDLVKLFDVVRNKIHDLNAKGQLGPVAGRINEVMTGKIGIDNPDFAEFRMLGSLIASGTLKAHFGARGGGLKIYEDFERQLGPQMSAGNLEGALIGMSAFMNQYATRARTAGDVKKTPPTPQPKSSVADPLGIR